MTTLNEIDELLGRQILEDVKDKPNNFSCLVVRDDNEYTRIYQQIAKIKTVIDAMDEPVNNLFLQRIEWTQKSKLKEADRVAQVLRVLHIQESMYRENYSLMLQVLWDRTNEVIQSDKDKQILHTRIVNLMLKMNRQFWNGRQLKEIFRLSTYNSEILKLPLSKQVGITKELIDKLNTTQQDFVNHFSD